MCMQYMRIKSVNYSAPAAQYVPCGKCAECRGMLRSAWSFRLRAELQSRCINDGWHCGFITLTYNDDSLPTIPQHLFRSYDSLKQVLENGSILTDFYGEELHAETYEVVPCFDRQDVRNLVLGMRKYLHKHYRVKGLVYCIAGEYGSNTRRPHYHGLFAWPPEVPDRVIYNLIQDYWTGTSTVVNDSSQLQFGNLSLRNNKGFICPRQFEGYRTEKPFVVNDVLAAANYASKYLVKDLYYAEEVNKYDLDFKSKEFKRYNCFHIQSRSLGVSILDKLDDEKKLDLYVNGYGFIGDETRSPIPVYIRNKLLFKPNYIIDGSGKRIVHRVCTDFFNRHVDEIYEKKHLFYSRLIERMCLPEYYLSRFVSRHDSKFYADKVNSIVEKYGSGSLARHYLCYFGVKKMFCYDYIPSKVWANRYDEFGSFVPPSAKTVSVFRLIEYDNAVSEILGHNRFTMSHCRTVAEARLENVSDFWKSQQQMR